VFSAIRALSRELRARIMLPAACDGEINLGGSWAIHLGKSPKNQNVWRGIGLAQESWPRAQELRTSELWITRDYAVVNGTNLKAGGRKRIGHPEPNQAGSKPPPLRMPGGGVRFRLNARRASVWPRLCHGVCGDCFTANEAAVRAGRGQSKAPAGCLRYGACAVL
jgi:hypothetical protein